MKRELIKHAHTSGAGNEARAIDYLFIINQTYDVIGPTSVSQWGIALSDDAPYQSSCQCAQEELCRLRLHPIMDSDPLSQIQTCHTYSKSPVHTGDYSRRFRRQTATVAKNGDSRRITATIVASVGRP